MTRWQRLAFWLIIFYLTVAYYHDFKISIPLLLHDVGLS